VHRRKTIVAEVVTLPLGEKCGARTLARSATVKSPWTPLQRGNSNLAKGDPLADFPQIFYNNEIGKEAPEARGGSLAPLDSQGR